MEQYISKSALVAEIEKRISRNKKRKEWEDIPEKRHQLIIEGQLLGELKHFLDSIEVKEVDLDVMQRMEECPYRQVGCTMYEGKIFECKGACSWVVDYPKLKELKAQKGE